MTEATKSEIRASVVKTLLIVAAPIIIGNLLESAMEIIDMHFIGTLGQLSMAGASMSINVIMLLMTLLMGLSIAVSAFISRAHGMGEVEKISHILGHALLIGVIVSVILAIVGIFFSEQILLLLSHGDAAIAMEGATYLRPELIGTVIFMLILVLTVAFQSVGDPVTPMLVLIGVNILNAILNPILISIMGLTGSAIATLIARGLGGVTLIVLMYAMPKHKKTGLRFPKRLSFDHKLFLNINAVAGPSAFQSCIRNLGLMIMTAIVAFYGQASVAAYGVCTRMDIVGLMIGMGIAQAVCVLVGQNLGAGNPERAVQTTRIAAIFNLVIMSIVAVIFVGFAPQILSFFGVSGEAMAVGLTWFSFIPFVSILMGLAMTFGFAMNGAGRTWPGMIAALTGQIVIPIALSTFFALNGYPIVYVFIAVGLGIVANFIIDFAFYKQGGWKNQKLQI